MKNYSLPELDYGLADLVPALSEEQLKIHYSKHHNAYVSGANTLLEKFDQADENSGFDVKAFAKAFSFQIGGYVLHNLFWKNLAPAGKGGGGEPAGAIGSAITENFKSFERFKQLFTETALGVEGSGWAALAKCKETGRLLIAQIEKHNANCYVGYEPILVLDMFEHAYYIDYKNDKSKYVEAFWSIVNWPAAEKRFIGGE